MKNKIIFWGGVILIWAMVVLGNLWVMGYQPQPKGRLVSDDEMVRMAVRRALKKMEANPPEIIYLSGQSSPFKPDHFVPYRDVDHFLEVNPNCCSKTLVFKTYGREIIDVYGKALYRDESGGLYSNEAASLLHRHFYQKGMYYLP